ncbi:MAG TPA: prolyl oligopeptidase family serine peptidase [Pyrinomonadaceae bacterium]
MKYLLWSLLLLILNAPINGQRVDTQKIRDALKTADCTEVEKSQIKVCKYDYPSNGLNVESVSFRPAGSGPFPGILLIPGYQRTALDQIHLGLSLARNGMAAVGVTQPGFGRSQGKADYVGPNTLRVLKEAYQKFKREPYVDSKRMGIYGFSRGGMAASLLAVQLDDLKAAVFGAGIYDFKRAHDEATIEGIRTNMESETGWTEAAIRERSSIFQMERLKCPVLILHGEKDINVPVSQAHLLRDRLTALKKDFEIQLFPDREHGIGPEVTTLTVDFFKRRLQPGVK